jgi:hypothetical protein
MIKFVILSAFNGRLRSEPMEWPEEAPEIRMPICRKLDRSWRIGKEAMIEGALDLKGLTTRIARFEHTGKYELLPNGTHAAIYELVDV